MRNLSYENKQRHKVIRKWPIPLSVLCTAPVLPSQPRPQALLHLLGGGGGGGEVEGIDPLHKWHLNLNNNTHTSLASHSCENSFVLKQESEARDVI